jgi:hypothetical protein
MLCHNNLSDAVDISCHKYASQPPISYSAVAALLRAFLLGAAAAGVASSAGTEVEELLAALLDARFFGAATAAVVAGWVSTPCSCVPAWSV